MPSTYTQNLGIEQPATGEQANTWGLTVNRNMDTLDTAINGNASLALSTSPYSLVIDNGADSPVAANPVIAWTGPQTSQGTVQIDYQSSRQHVYIMRNQTTGGFGIAFMQGSGTQFVLNAGYDACIYADGGGTGANVAAAIANPQFNNLLLTGSAQVNQGLTVNTTLMVTGNITGTGNASLYGSLGLGNASSLPDPLTINGIGSAGQLRLIGGGYGFILRNDGNNFYMMMTAVNDPYGAYAIYPVTINLASGAVGIGQGVGPNSGYSLNVGSLNTASLTVTGAASVAANLGVGGSLGVDGMIAVDENATNNGNGIDLAFGNGSGEGIGSARVSGGSNLFGLNFFTGSAIRMYITNNGGVGIGMMPDQTLTVNGVIHTLGGIEFPDGTKQTTAIANTFQNLTVNGILYGPSNWQGVVMQAAPAIPEGYGPNLPTNTIGLFVQQNTGYLFWWWRKWDGTLWYEILSQNFNQWTGPVV